MIAAPPTRQSAAALFCWLLLVPSLARAGLADLPRYRAADLGALYPGGSAWPSDLNDRGDVVGIADVPDGRQRAFLYRAGRMRDLGPSWAPVYPVLNGRGDVALVRVRADESRQLAVRSADGTTRDVGGAAGAHVYELIGISDDGQVAGTFYGGFGQPHAFVTEGDRLVDLTARAGATGGGYVAIDATGRVTFSADGRYLAYERGMLAPVPPLAFPTVPPLPGRDYSIVLDRNARGDEVGFSGYETFGDSGGPGLAAAILVRDGAATDLNGLVVPDADVYVEVGQAINEARQIAARGFGPGGGNRAYLLTPVGGTGGGPPQAVPLPPLAWAGLATLAGVGLAQARRRWRNVRS